MALWDLQNVDKTSSIVLGEENNNNQYFHRRIIYLRDYSWVLILLTLLDKLYYLPHDLVCKIISFWLQLGDNFGIKEIVDINIYENGMKFKFSQHF